MFFPFRKKICQMLFELGLLLQLLPVSFAAATTQRCPVYSYYDDFNSLVKKESWEEQEKVEKSQYDHKRLLDIWVRNWYANGWYPIILSRNDSMAHPHFKELSSKFAQLPTANNPKYELACYERWIAFAQRGGGVFCDYDVVNFHKSMLPKSAGPCGRGPMISYPELLPMLIMGDRPEVESMLETFAKWEVDPVKDQHKGRPHISDMIIARRGRHMIFDQLLPNPGSVAHFNTDTFYGVKRVCPEIEGLLRYEWLNANMACIFKRGKRVYLVGEVPELLEKHFEKECEFSSPVCLVPALRPDAKKKSPPEYQLVKTDHVPADIGENDFVIVILPTPPQEDFIMGAMWRAFLGKGAQKQDPVKQIMKDSGSIGELLSHPNVFVGLADHLHETLSVLDFVVGYKLPFKDLKPKAQPVSENPTYMQVFNNLMDRYRQIKQFK